MQMMVLVAAAAVGFAAGQAVAKSKATEVVWPADAIQFKQAVPGVTKAILWGDDTKGAYASLTKFAAGTKNLLHTHANDIKLVVIKGSYNYGTEKGEQKLGPGSYVLVPAGRKHTSGTDEDSLFFEESNGKFTLDIVKEMQKAEKK